MKMQTRPFPSPSTHHVDAPQESRALVVAEWVASVVVAVLFGMGAFAKFFNYTPEGSMALADALGVGRGVVTAIGLVETVALVAILVPRTRLVGALLAAGTMVGALLSHATRIGFSGNPAAEMWPLALVALLAAGFIVVTRWRNFPTEGPRRM